MFESFLNTAFINPLDMFKSGGQSKQSQDLNSQGVTIPISQSQQVYGMEWQAQQEELKRKALEVNRTDLMSSQMAKLFLSEKNPFQNKDMTNDFLGL